MDLMYITNQVDVAIKAENAGIERIFVDLEKNGKLERQGHLDTHIADHDINDLSKIKKVLKNSKLLVRVNPIFEGSQHEIDTCVEQGADIIMLPMFKTKGEVEQFVQYVNGRATVCLLLETAQAFVRIKEILEVPGIDEIHVGLNDLHLSMNLDFMFELLSEGIVEYLSQIFSEKSIRFGFGGIARIGEGDIPAEIVLGEHYRLNSKMVILSRAFRCDMLESGKLSLEDEIEKIRLVESEIKKWDRENFKSNMTLLKTKTRQVVKNKQKRGTQ